MLYSEECIKKIDEIYKITIDNKIEDLSIMTGRMGQILFLGYYQKYNKKVDLTNYITSSIDFILQDLSKSEKISHAFCSGVAGIGWAIKIWSHRLYKIAKRNKYSR